MHLNATDPNFFYCIDLPKFEKTKTAKPKPCPVRVNLNPKTYPTYSGTTSPNTEKPSDCCCPGLKRDRGFGENDLPQKFKTLPKSARRPITRNTATPHAQNPVLGGSLF
jgi:hypothetical protein